ncbi:MAG: hypothetical protein O3A47_01510 [Chloroflexi bacterium]|nr:hypothetical protein [Chloroflexota bacterium]
MDECTDPDGRIEQLMWGLAPISGKVGLDIGAGSDFHTVKLYQRGSPSADRGVAEQILL